MPAGFRLSLAVLVAALVFSSHGTAAEPRFTAMLADGKRVSGAEANPWFAPGHQPKLGGAALLEAGNHARWLRDNSLEPAESPPAYVEFFGGDRLPGKALEFRRGDESPFEHTEGHLLVDHEHAFDHPDHQRRRVRVSTRWVRRVVWQRRGDGRYQPGTLIERDGRRLQFRSLRWGRTSALLLLDDDTANVPYSRMAELHLPRRDPWVCYYKQVALLAPGGLEDKSTRLLRLETTDGLTATTSAARLFPTTHGSNNPDRWHHSVQPAWSLDPLWVRHRSVYFRRWWRPHVVPLSGVEVEGERSARDGTRWPWRFDRNVRGGVLRGGAGAFGWGVGMHAPSRLTFSLPELARTFRTRVGLDASCGQGGCAKALIYTGKEAGPPRYQSPFIIGSADVLTPPAIPLSGAKQLTLVADPAHRGRPDGADPLNIRDMLNWLEPEMELDLAGLQREIASSAPSLLPAWDGWTVTAPGGGAPPVELASFLSLAVQSRPANRTLVQSGKSPVVLTRRLRVGKNDRWLGLFVSRSGAKDGPAKIAVELAGKPWGPFDLPRRQPQDEPPPLLLAVEAFRDKPVDVKITVNPSGPDAALDWRAISLLRNPPGLLPLLEDQPNLAERLKQGPGKAAVDEEDKHHGRLSLKVSEGQKRTGRWDGLPVAIREHPRYGEYRYIRFVWKKSGGGRVCLSLGHAGRFGPLDEEDATPRGSFRYDAGGGEPSHGAALRLGGAPGGWVMVTRDLYADFGETLLTGLAFSALDGGEARFDHVYLGRTSNDFNDILKLTAENE